MPTLGKLTDQRSHERRRLAEERMLGFAFDDLARFDPATRRLYLNTAVSPEARRRFVSDWRTARARGFEKYRSTVALVRAVDGSEEVKRSFASFVIAEFHKLQKSRGIAAHAALVLDEGE